MNQMGNPVNGVLTMILPLKPMHTRPCCSAATRAQSLSRELRKPQIESVKKNLVIESCESILESFRHKGLQYCCLGRAAPFSAQTGGQARLRHF